VCGRLLTDDVISVSIYSNAMADKGATVVFKDVCVTLSKTDILNNVYGMAKVGQMLAVMGPSGMLITSSIFIAVEMLHDSALYKFMIDIYD